MNQKVQEWITKQENAHRDLLRKEKAKKLISLGLCEKEYSPDGKYTIDYPGYDDAVGKYYKTVPCEVTDGEYEEILRYEKYAKTSDGVFSTALSEKNRIAGIFTVVAWIVFAVGFVLGLVFGVVRTGYYGSEFSFALALKYWAISFLSGMFLLGFAEIIQLLSDIKGKIQ